MSIYSYSATCRSNQHMQVVNIMSTWVWERSTSMIFCGMTSDVQVSSYTFVDDSCLSVIRSARFLIIHSQLMCMWPDWYLNHIHAACTAFWGEPQFCILGARFGKVKVFGGEPSPQVTITYHTTASAQTCLLGKPCDDIHLLCMSWIYTADVYSNIILFHSPRHVAS